MHGLQSRAHFAFQLILQVAGSAALALALLSPSPGAAVILDFSTLFGASGKDMAADVALDASGNIFLTGVIGATTFPGLDLLSLPNGGRGQVFVAKFDPNGKTLLYVTAVGTPAATPSALAVDAGGSAYVAAFESTGASGRTIGSLYLYKLDASGRVQWAFRLDPAVYDVRAIAVDASGSAYLAGNAGLHLVTTAGVVYPATNRTSGLTPCLIKVDPAGQRALYSTYLSQAGQRAYTNPSSYDRPPTDFLTTPYAIAVDGAGSAYVTGQATSDFGATPGAPDLGSTVHSHTFVAKMNSTGTALSYVARFGGANSDRGTGIAVFPDGSAVVAGKALATGTSTAIFDFPVIRGALGSVFQGDVYCFSNCGSVDPQYGYILKLKPDGTPAFSGLVSACQGALAASTIYYSSNAQELPLRIALDAAGNIWAIGSTCSQRGFPSPNAVFPALSSGAFLMEIAGDGHTQLFGTTFGGGFGSGLAVDGYGNVAVAGYGALAGFPLVSSWQSAVPLPASAAQANAFLMRLSDVPLPVSLSVDVNPAVSTSPVHLTATVGASRDQGAVEFHDGGAILASSPLAGGVATLGVTLPAGIHPLTAVYRGPGQYDGTSSPTIFETVNTSCP